METVRVFLSSLRITISSDLTALSVASVSKHELCTPVASCLMDDSLHSRWTPLPLLALFPLEVPTLPQLFSLHCLSITPLKEFC